VWLEITGIDKFDKDQYRSYFKSTMMQSLTKNARDIDEVPYFDKYGKIK
jgi:hypothetical protein